jgi:hypothetical protein
VIRPLVTAALAAGSCAAILTTSGALAAYGSPRLQATQSGNAITIDIAQSAGDDATAIVRIISPPQTEIAESQPAGTNIGRADATFVATAAGGGELTAGGALQVSGDPIGPAGLAGCAEGERVEGLWSMHLEGAGLSMSVPVYLLVGGDLLLCLPHPTTLAQGAKLIGLTLTITGALRLRPVGTWISIWVPYGTTEADLSRAAASPAVVGVGTVTFTARSNGGRRSHRGARATGRRATRRCEGAHPRRCATVAPETSRHGDHQRHRPVHVPREVGDVLPRGSIGRAHGAARDLLRPRAVPAADPLREPDAERLLGAERDHPEALTSD